MRDSEIRAALRRSLVLELQASESMRLALAEVRNKLATLDPSDYGYPEAVKRELDQVLGAYEERVNRTFPVARALEEGVATAKKDVEAIARFPVNATFGQWRPSFPVEVLRVWESQTLGLLRGVGASVRSEILRTLQLGVIGGQGHDAIAAEILGTGITGRVGRDGVFRKAVNRASLISRYTVNELVNRTALLTYGRVNQVAPELALKIVWQTVPDARRSAVCASLQGQIRELGKPFEGDGFTGYNPPAHLNCRSRVTALGGRAGRDLVERFPPTREGTITEQLGRSEEYRRSVGLEL